MEYVKEIHSKTIQKINAVDVLGSASIMLFMPSKFNKTTAIESTRNIPPYM
jgi:hypothetical protein